MARGAMQVVGSSLYLKNRFGLGYHLSMSIAEGADVARVTALVKAHVPLASKEADLGADAMTATANRELAEARRKDNATRKAAAVSAGAGAGAGAAAPDGEEEDGAADVQHVQLSYVLPMDSVAKFAGLFRALEDQGADLAIQNYGLSSAFARHSVAPPARCCACRACVYVGSSHRMWRHTRPLQP